MLEDTRVRHLDFSKSKGQAEKQCSYASECGRNCKQPTTKHKFFIFQNW